MNGAYVLMNKLTWILRYKLVLIFYSQILSEKDIVILPYNKYCEDYYYYVQVSEMKYKIYDFCSIDRNEK